MFHEVLDHVARVDRVLTSPSGSLLLSGQSGVGRRSAVRLVAHMHQLEVVTPHVSRTYTLKHFKNDLKNVSCNSRAHAYLLRVAFNETAVCCSSGDAGGRCGGEGDGLPAGGPPDPGVCLP